MLPILGAGVLAAGGDGPDGFDLVAAAGVEAVVKVHAGIAVRDDQFDALADRRQLAAGFAGEGAELVAGFGIGQARPVLGLGPRCVVVVSTALVPASIVTRSACVALTTVASTVRLGWKSV